MRSLSELFGAKPKVTVEVDPVALMRENIRLQVENVELRCRLAAGGRAVVNHRRDKVRAIANAMAVQLGKPMPFAGQPMDSGEVS